MSGVKCIECKEIFHGFGVVPSCVTIGGETPVLPEQVLSTVGLTTVNKHFVKVAKVCLLSQIKPARPKTYGEIGVN